MIVKKKKFVMDVPDPTDSGIKVQNDFLNSNLNNSRVNDSGFGSLNHESSTKQLVKDTQLGPSALKQRQPLQQWP